MFRSVLIVFCFVTLACGQAWAVIDLNVSPVGGGRDMRFGKIGTPVSQNKELRFRITSDENTQYQIFQRIIEPFTNNRGETLDRQAVLASSVQGSNGSGTLYLNTAERMSFTDQLVYTSSPQGMSDTFTVIYKIDELSLNQSGEFFGRILYTLRPVRGTSRDEVVLDVFFETSGDFTVDSKTSDGGRSLVFSGGQDPFGGEYVELAFAENIGNEVVIYQELIEEFTNEDYERLEPDILSYRLTGLHEEALYAPSPVALDKRRELIYRSQEHDDRVRVHFDLDEDRLAEHTAGTYNGMIRYTVETRQKETVLDVHVDIDIQPVFKMVIEYPDGGVTFPKLLPHLPAQDREVLVKVQTNLGRPYSVNQEVRDPMANENGEEFERKFFLVKEEKIDDSDGLIQHVDFVPVQPEDMPLFYSDDEGSSTEFKVIYRLVPHAGMQPGTYRSQIVYSLGEL